LNPDPKSLQGVILSGAVFQAQRRACPEQVKRAEGISRLTGPSRKPKLHPDHAPIPVAPKLALVIT